MGILDKLLVELVSLGLMTLTPEHTLLCFLPKENNFNRDRGCETIR